jgi:hypothetical protein
VCCSEGLSVCGSSVCSGHTEGHIECRCNLAFEGASHQHDGRRRKSLSMDPGRPSGYPPAGSPSGPSTWRLRDPPDASRHTCCPSHQSLMHVSAEQRADIHASKEGGIRGTSPASPTITGASRSRRAATISARCCPCGPARRCALPLPPWPLDLPMRSLPVRGFRRPAVLPGLRGL